ncbi:MAG: sigma-70 family RNA polymerase sigma factor [Bacteroidales bacterium]|nr:sigma-70 family RNA polymerase sigma factor [Bacteroidales bacterium]
METTTDHRIVHQELLEACKRGDPQAQMKLYKLYYKPMYHVSLRILSDPMEAEDVMQEAFLVAFRAMTKIDLSISFGGWLKRIVINRSVDALRKRKGVLELTTDIPEETDYQDESIEKTETTEEKVGMIKRAMQRLPEKYRLVLSLNLFEGYDHEEIGQILGIPASTSRAHLSRGKQKLLQLIGR